VGNKHKLIENDIGKVCIQNQVMKFWAKRFWVVLMENN